MSGSRRAASPVRLGLADELGGDIDGAWWPRSSMIAAELPDLVGALHVRLGEIVDIRVNWTPAEGQYDLGSVVTGTRLRRAGGTRRPPRLMVVSGRVQTAKLLVIPSMTSQALGAIVVRVMAGLPTSSGTGDAELFETARTVLGIAKAESARWSAAVAP